MISFFGRNYDSYFGHDLRVPNAEQRAKYAPKEKAPEQATLIKVATGERKLEDYRTHPYTKERELVSARLAYENGRSYAKIRKHLERAIAGARSTGDALAVAQFSYDHVMVYSGSTWRGGPYESSAHALVEEAGTRAIELVHNPHELSDVVRLFSAFRCTQGNTLVEKAFRRAEELLNDPLSLVAFANSVPSGSLRGSRWHLLAKATLLAKTPLELDLIENAAKGIDDPCGRLAWALARRRECPGDELVLNPWYAGVKEQGMSR
jgi:hypothetical protein